MDNEGFAHVLFRAFGPAAPTHRTPGAIVGDHRPGFIRANNLDQRSLIRQQA